MVVLTKANKSVIIYGGGGGGGGQGQARV